MKKKTLFALALAAAICATPLAGCDSEVPAGKPFEIKNYAIDLPDDMTVASRYREVPAFTTVQTIPMSLSSLSENPEMAIEYGTKENQNKCRLYSLKKEAAASDWYTSISTYDSDSPYLILTNVDSSNDYVYQVAWPTGELLVNEDFSYYPYFTTESGTYSTESGSALWYGLTYYPDDGGEAQDYYAAYVDGAWKKLTEKDIYGDSEDYKVGDVLGVAKTPLVSLARYPDYIYKDYSYIGEGNGYSYKYTFYKGNDKLDSVTVFNNMVCGVVGHYFYYYEETPLNADAESGYNVEIVSSYGMSQKINAVLHRYDFVDRKDETVDTNYFFEPSSILYNKTTNDFDRIVVRAYKETNGVAIVSQSSEQYSLILDDEANVSFDLTAKNLSAPFYRLSDDRFLTGRTIVDKDLNTIAQMSYSSFAVWKEQSLIITRGNNSYMAINYDGKVTLSGMSSVVGTCGDYLLAYNRKGAITAFSKAVPEGKSMFKVTGEKNTVYMNDLLYVQTENNYVFYNLDGKKIGEYEGAFNSSNRIVYEGKYFFNVRNGSDYVTLLFK